MSLEVINTFATLGTFVVIAATAIAAIVQLRHARGSNQIAALNELRASWEKEDFSAAQHFVNTGLSIALEDPAFRYQIENPAARTAETHAAIKKVFMLGNFYESLGILVYAQLIDRNLVLDFWAGNITQDWERFSQFTVILRRKGSAAVYENFEYLTVLSQDWIAAHPSGVYPAGTRRIDLTDRTLEADRRYVASLGTT